MRILHTTDWYLGQHFMGKTRQAENEAFTDWLIKQVRDHAADTVIIAGDTFDTGAPSSYAQELHNLLVVELHNTGTTLLMLGGNHDSVATLGESRPLLSYLSTTVIPAVEEDLDNQVLVLNKRDDSPGAIVCAIPSIRPRDVLLSQGGQSAEENQLSLQGGNHQHCQAVYLRACGKRDTLRLPLPIIATGHLTMVGASATESVREIYVGALEAFPTTAFSVADYIALGHIHRPQKVGGLDHIHYCGSPISLSFYEASQQKEVLLVDVDDIGLMGEMALPVPCFQQLGDLKELEAVIQEAAQLCRADPPIWLDCEMEGLLRSTGIQNQLSIDTRLHRPANGLSRQQVEHHCRVQPPTCVRMPH